MKIDIAYGRDLDDSMLEQLQFMEADACAYYDSLDANPNETIIGAIPSETLKQFKRRTASTLFLMKTKKTKSRKTMLIGMSCISRRGRTSDMYLHTVFVRALYRRKGIGSALVKKAMSTAKHNGYSLLLTVNPLNIDAMHLYESLGFSICKEQSLTMKFNVNRKTAKKKAVHKAQPTNRASK